MLCLRQWLPFCAISCSLASKHVHMLTSISFLTSGRLLVQKKRRFPCQHLSQLLAWQVTPLLFLKQLLHQLIHSLIPWMNWVNLQNIKGKAMKVLALTAACLRIQALSTRLQNQNLCLPQRWTMYQKIGMTRAEPETQILYKISPKGTLPNSIL